MENTGLERLPLRFLAIVERIAALEGHPDYRGAFLFGSLARGDVTERSDVDAQVITARDNPRLDVLHPVFDGIKVDISFMSLAQLEAESHRQAQGGRRPMLAQARILFDLGGAVAALQDRVKLFQPPPVERRDLPQILFDLHHMDDKVRRLAGFDPEAAHLSMHTEIEGLLKIHYRLQRRFHMGSKQILGDLTGWDPDLAELVRAYLTAPFPDGKIAVWTRMIERVRRPLEGVQPFTENPYISQMSKQGLRQLGFES